MNAKTIGAIVLLMVVVSIIVGVAVLSPSRENVTEYNIAISPQEPGAVEVQIIDLAWDANRKAFSALVQELHDEGRVGILWLSAERYVEFKSQRVATTWVKRR